MAHLWFFSPKAGGKNPGGFLGKIFQFKTIGSAKGLKKKPVSPKKKKKTDAGKPFFFKKRGKGETPPPP